jgi:hypothetical protein
MIDRCTYTYLLACGEYIFEECIEVMQDHRPIEEELLLLVLLLLYHHHHAHDNYDNNSG